MVPNAEIDLYGRLLISSIKPNESKNTLAEKYVSIVAVQCFAQRQICLV